MNGNFKTIYNSGILTAISYEDGIEIGRMDLETANEIKSIRISTENITETFNGRALAILKRINEKDSISICLKVEDTDIELRVENLYF